VYDCCEWETLRSETLLDQLIEREFWGYETYYEYVAYPDPMVDPEGFMDFMEDWNKPAPEYIMT